MPNWSQSVSDADPRKAFLEHFDPLERSMVMNSFLFAVRGGAAHPVDVIDWVRRTAGDKAMGASQYGGHAGWSKAIKLSRTIGQNPEEATALAEYALEYESLSPEEKDKRKQQRAHIGATEWMSTQPPTLKQLAFLSKLGSREQPRDRAHASQLIDSLLTDQAMTHD